MVKVKRLTDLNGLGAIAKELLQLHHERRVFAFFGNMGAGKTTFIQAVCSALGVVGEVSSPTFALINEYCDCSGQAVYHFDFYRIKNVTEAMDIGYENYFYSGRYCLIEWPEKIIELLPVNCVYVKIEETGTTAERMISF